MLLVFAPDWGLLLVPQPAPMAKVGVPNFVSGPREYIMEGEYVILAMCSWFRIS